MLPNYCFDPIPGVPHYINNLVFNTFKSLEYYINHGTWGSLSTYHNFIKNILELSDNSTRYTECVNKYLTKLVFIAYKYCFFNDNVQYCLRNATCRRCEEKKRVIADKYKKKDAYCLDCFCDRLYDMVFN